MATLFKPRPEILMLRCAAPIGANIHVLTFRDWWFARPVLKAFTPSLKPYPLEWRGRELGFST